MKLTIINGSHRYGSQSKKVSEFLKSTATENGFFSEVDIISLEGNPIPLWDEDVWNKTEEWGSILDPIREKFMKSDAFVVVAPEWHGQVPSGLKNLFLMCTSQEVGHKPALITSVSSVDGGAYVVAELRMSSYKNNRICYIPEQLIIRNVEKVLNRDKALNDPEADQYFRQRSEWALNLLKQYSTALKLVRDSGVALSQEFSNGM